jgi:hypothetical protein
VDRFGRYERYEFGRGRVNYEAIIAFIAGVIVAYLLQFSLGFGGGNFFTVLIVVAVGGLWYHIRRII